MNKMSKFLILFMIGIIPFVSGFEVFALNNNYNNTKLVGHIANFEDLGDYYSGQKACSKAKDSQECKNGVQYKFYLKMYDLYYLYRNKYKVKLDLPLIMSTLITNEGDISNVFSYNLSDYDRKVLVDSRWNPSETTPLDWDYDYETQYNYLAANDYSMDMQILAKNMVTKTETQKCVKDGKTIKSQTVKDTEEELQCGDGETLERSNASYKLDLEKYDEFLSEYLEYKRFLNNIIENPVRSNGPEPYAVSGVNPGRGSFTSDDNSNGSGGGSGSTSTQPPATATGIAAIDKMTEIGLKRDGDGGYEYYSFLGFGGRVEWCACFVSWLFNQVGGLNKYIKSSACAGEVPRSSEAAGYGVWYEDECTDPNTVPKAGDIILYDPYVGGGYIPYPSNGGDKYFSSHIGYVYKVDDQNVYTIEGNSGDIVQVKTISRKKCGYGVGQGINGYFRPNY